MYSMQLSKCIFIGPTTTTTKSEFLLTLNLILWYPVLLLTHCHSLFKSFSPLVPEIFQKKFDRFMPKIFCMLLFKNYFVEQFSDILTASFFLIILKNRVICYSIMQFIKRICCVCLCAYLFVNHYNNSD